MVTRTGGRDHIIFILKQLQWLPVKSRIKYKLLTLRFLDLSGLAPSYIIGLLELYKSARSLRSSSGPLLKEQRFRLCQYRQSLLCISSKALESTAT